jgi:hypothetical protein
LHTQFFAGCAIAAGKAADGKGSRLIDRVAG